MELLSNLAWAIVITALWGVWLFGRHGRSRASLLPAIGVQFLALAMLSAILLPVISVTDDLQFCHNPAEVERASGRNDRHGSFDQSPHPLPVALALLSFCPRIARPQVIAILIADELGPRQQSVHARVVWSRPPPSA